MTQTLGKQVSENPGMCAGRWPQAAAVASALLLGVASPAAAGDIGSFFGGVVGGMLNQSMQPHYYPPPQQYYQQPQYYQAEPRTYQRRSSASSAEARRQAELKKKKEEEEKAKKEEAAAAAMAPPAAAGSASGPIDVQMKRKGGNLWVPAQINNVVTIDFVIDSGASDITLPRDVYLTLIRSGTLTKANYIGATNFGIADGSEVKGVRFKLASLQVGNQVLHDVVASVMPSDSATPLLGLSFLSRFQSWSVDNNSGTLKLTPIGAPTNSAPTQVASATQQPLPDLPAADTAAAPATASAAAPATTVMKAAEPEPRMAAATPDAPRSGHVANSAFIVKETGTPTAAAAAPTAAPIVASAAPTAAAQPAAKPGVPVFPANTPYGNARTTLMALGYGPAPLPDAGKCDSNTDLTCFPERAACLKADGIQCDFLWRRGEELIKVKTVAIPPTVSSVECQVNCK